MRAAGLQERLTFDSFVEGQGNAFALAIADECLKRARDDDDFVDWTDDDGEDGSW